MEKVAVCEEKHHHEGVVDVVKGKLPCEETLYDLADLFKVFGDFTRIKIICALFEHELCVCDIAEVTGMAQSAISHQLRILKQADLVGFRREGKTIYYSLKDDHVFLIYQQALAHVNE